MFIFSSKLALSEDGSRYNMSTVHYSLYHSDSKCYFSFRYWQMGNIHIFTLYCINTTFHTLNFNDSSKKGVIVPKNHHELKFEVSKNDYPSLFLAFLYSKGRQRFDLES